MNTKQKAECYKAMVVYKENLCEVPTNTEFLEGDFSHGYQAHLESEGVKKLVEGIEFTIRHCGQAGIISRLKSLLEEFGGSDD